MRRPVAAKMAFVERRRNAGDAGLPDTTGPPALGQQLDDDLGDVREAQPGVVIEVALLHRAIADA